MTAPRVVVMGVSGCGKSTVGRLLADGWACTTSKATNCTRRRTWPAWPRASPLTDADRHGWLQAVAGQLVNATTEARGVVVTCSALKRRYRDQLRAGAADTRFVHLHGARELLAARCPRAPGHYMPPSLLQSQLDTLEPPGADERALSLPIDLPPEQLAAQARPGWPPRDHRLLTTPP
jgi:gluconokinase